MNKENTETNEENTLDAEGDSMQRLVMQREVYDRWGADEESPMGYPASNEDGTKPKIDGDTIWIKETSCHCGSHCGGCVTGWHDYPIDGERFHVLA